MADVEIIRSWERPDPFKIYEPEQGKTYKWVDKSKMEQRINEGWKPCTDGRNKDGENREYRDLGLCLMPKEMADERKAFYSRRANRANEEAEAEFRAASDASGFQSIGKISTNKSKKYY